MNRNISIIPTYNGMDLFNRQEIFNRTIKAIPLQSSLVLFDCSPGIYIDIGFHRVKYKNLNIRSELLLFDVSFIDKIAIF